MMPKPVFISYSTDDTAIADTGAGSAPIADMGAYERFSYHLTTSGEPVIGSTMASAASPSAKTASSGARSPMEKLARWDKSAWQDSQIRKVWINAA